MFASIVTVLTFLMSWPRPVQRVLMCILKAWGARFLMRSEEHTSELQSRGHLVCRLLLEKKKDTTRHLTAQKRIGERIIPATEADEVHQLLVKIGDGGRAELSGGAPVARAPADPSALRPS